MMSALTSIRNYSKLIHDPSQILEKINNDLCNRNIDDMFVTVWLGILDLNTGSK
ncbi:MAG: serine/threonine-protein phosphatase [Eubacterium sp.]|nr:serine/threonine-protein phosphatase [Eubacterium sp.]